MKAVAFAAVTSLVLLFVWERVDIVRIGYHIERLKAQKVLLERERDELRVKLSGLTAQAVRPCTMRNATRRNRRSRTRLIMTPPLRRSRSRSSTSKMKRRSLPANIENFWNAAPASSIPSNASTNSWTSRTTF